LSKLKVKLNLNINNLLAMNHYRGEVRRQPEQTPSKLTLENDKNNFEQLQQEKYSRNNDF
jgi:hypothetical protein